MRFDQIDLDLFHETDSVRYLTLTGVLFLDPEINYDPKEIVKRAIELGDAQRLGYVIDLALTANRENPSFEKYTETKRAKRVLSLLTEYVNKQNPEYQFLLQYNKPTKNQQKINLRRKKLSKTEQNLEWRVYSALVPQDAADYIELYLIHNNNTRYQYQ